MKVNYIEKEDALEELRFVKESLFLVDKFVYDTYLVRLKELFPTANFSLFTGEVSEVNLNKYLSSEAKVVIGMGGGKVLDASKVLADILKAKGIVIPTSAASDAPCTNIAVVYNEDGSLLEYRKVKRPDLVLVDPKIIIAAPIRLLKAGISDALSTYYELRTTKNYKIVINEKELLARECLEIINNMAFKAVQDASKGVISSEFLEVIRANIYLSGLASEDTVALAHTVSYLLSDFKETKNLLHGEKVACGLVLMLAYEEAKELAVVKELLEALEIPYSFNAYGLNLTEEEIKDFSKKIKANNYYEVDEAKLIKAIKAINS